MIGMHYSNNLQTKSVLGVTRFASSISSSTTEAKGKKEGSFATNEHISMLDTTRRSPSPSTSTSTLSSSLGNGGGNSGGGGNTGSIVVGSESSTQQGTISVNEHSTTTVGGGDGGGGGRKEEWAAELQPFSAGVELGHGGAERFNLGMEDWEGLLSESAGQDQSLLRWISGDIEDGLLGLKQLLQGVNPNDIEANVGFEAIDQSSGFEALATGGSSASGNNNMMLLASLNSSALGLSASGVSLNSDNNGKFGSIPNSLGLNNSINGSLQNPNLSASVNNSLSLPPGLGFQQQQLQFSNLEQKPQNLNPPLMVNQLQRVQSAASVNFLNPLLCGTQQERPPAKRHNPGIVNPSADSQMLKDPFVDPSHELLLRKQQLPQMQQPHLGLGQQLNLLPSHPLHQKPLMVPKQELVGGGGGGDQVAFRQQQLQQEQQVLYGELFKATELILAGNFSQAQGILARLNHQLSPNVKPYQRSAFYFKEALQQAFLLPNTTASMQPRFPSPFDCMFKMSAYKAFSEASPLIQFTNFTSNQALLEALDDAEHIHIVDFDIGFGAQWSSFMQELPRRNRGPPSSLKITAFSSPSNHHSIEISLMHENLTQFANDVGINFELEVVNFDNFDPKLYPASSLRSSENEAIAVNFPIWSISNHLPKLPSLLCFIKQLSPKIIVSLDRGCERVELPFSHHLIHALQYFEVLMDSIDAANMLSDTANKIEKFLFQPKIESIVLGRLHYPDLMPSWRNLFVSAGFSPVAFSNFAETQAECMVKRTHVRGFHVEKRQALLVLCWQCRELLSASVWRC